MNDVVPARGSRRSRGAAAVSAVTVRQISRLVPPELAWGMWLSRRIIAGIMGTLGPSLAGTRVEQVNTVTPDGRRVRGEWVYGPRNRSLTGNGDGTGTGTGGVIYYLHGSSYTMCSPRTHRRLTSWLSSLTGLPVFCVEYRLAPRHRFPTAADDVRAGWDWVLETCGLPPERIAIAGDSAGGHLAVDLLLQPEVAAKHPAAAVLFSPLFDLTFALCAASERIRRDPTIRAATAARVVGLYHAGIDPAHHRLKLDVAAGPAFPPTLIQAGGAEMLQGDARQLADEIRAAGGSCELQVWPHQLHVFQALPKIAPEAAKAMAYAAGFIANSLCGNAENALVKDKAG
jgi:monoterpene epsilon-lactone hydrolase